MTHCPYSCPQAILNEYNTINKTGTVQESIKSWNCHPPNHKTWIDFKNNFRKAYLEITKTRELTLEQVGYDQANLVEDIVSRFFTEYQYQDNISNSVPPEEPSPTIATGTA